MTTTNPITALYDPRRITPGDPEWPDQLDQLDPPVTELWISGTGNLHDLLTKSIVCTGARAATSYGAHVSTEISADLTAEGWTIVTGGNFGIEAAATRGALSHRKPAVIVAGCGLNIMYPAAHASLFAGVLAAGGLMVSEYAPDTIGRKASFQRRSQLLGALTSGVVMVEAAQRTGTMATVNAAEAIGAPVFAIPGPVTSAVSATPHQLIRDGRAILATCAADIMEEYDN